MFERFSMAARTVVKAAVAEAERRDDPRIGTEHLLIAVLGAPLTVDRRALGALDTTGEALRSLLGTLDTEALASVGVAVGTQRSAVRSEFPSRRRHLPFTQGARDTLRKALREAVDLWQRSIGPEHLLLGLLHLADSDTAG
ncbi:MAG: hypothetical protein M3349_03285, partial [Actinomycetota bacterium]|nr:hypothetical protein [Actinomycetota bacterium]